MRISRAIAGQMESSSWIRRMFEIGLQLRRERGAGNGFDYSIGNPDVEPPYAVANADVMLPYSFAVQPMWTSSVLASRLSTCRST